MKLKEAEATKRLKALNQHLSKIKKKCKTSGIWLSAGYDPLKNPTDEEQQGPLINKLYELIDDNKKFLKGK